MDRRRTASGSQGLSHAKALEKLKSELWDVLDPLRDVGRLGTRRGGRGVGDVRGAVDEEANAATNHEVVPVANASQSPLQISTAIPFDFWSVGLLALSVVLLLVSQVGKP